jgi:nitric oxide reductase NorD protein
MFEFLELEETVGKFWHRLVGSTSSLPRYPEHAVTFDEVKPFLATCFRGFGGEATAQLGPAHSRTSQHRLRLRQLIGLGEEKTAWASRDGGAVMLPPTVELFPDRDLNRSLYIWLAAYLATMPQTVITAADPLKADIAALDAARKAVDTVLAQFPGLATRYRALCRAMLAERSRAVLPPVEKLVENRIVGMLSAGAGYPDANPPSILPRSAPAGYQRMLGVPLWPVYEPRPEVQSGGADDESHSGTANAMEGDGRFQAERETSRTTTDRSPFILNRFEKIFAMAEMVNVDRPTDDKDDTDKDAARDLDEVRLGRRKERPSSKFRFDLDLPPEAVDPSSIEGETTYPEWNYRKGEYMPSYCRVICGTAPVDAESVDRTEEEKSLIRRVRKQFEILRPRNEVLRAQLDGSDLDLDAVVRMRADLAAGGEGSDRIHLLSRPQGHDLAVSILVDVSLSTDAWFDDRRVLDVEKEALAVLANGLAACGTNHSILTFTSRRRSWVRIETVKAFGEEMSENVERRIASLKPGYYTRIGAAIRHASAELGKQPNRTKLLLVLTDGKPNDIDHYEGRFALEDSRKAVVEARRAGHAVFAVTVDKDARSYLPSMFGRNGFAIVGDIAKLPRALPAIYRGLTR